jgi:hypothetical protein
MRKITQALASILFIVCVRSSGLAQYRHTGRLNVWTVAQISRLNAPDGQFRILRVARHDGFDRAIFEFADGVPSFSVRYQKRPVLEEGTMAPVEISGSAVLVVTFQFYYGENVSIYQGFPKGPLDLAVLTEIKNIDASEAVMSYALGVQGRHAFRVTTLANPARLVVDIKQGL